MPARMIRTVLFAACLAGCATQTEAQQAAAPPAQPEAAQSQAQPQTSAPARTMEQTIESVATVTAIDKATREVTLKNEKGESSTVKVPDDMTRLDEVSVGDRVHARYTVSVTSELRAPTEEEKKEPFVAVEGGGKADANEAPAAGGARMFRIVATVEAIDKQASTATLKGPNGNTVVVEVQDPTMLDRAKVGDTVVVTAAESVVLSLEKVEKKSKK